MINHDFGEQGKFGDYHDLLFANQAKLDKQSLIQYARRLKLDEMKFEERLPSGQYARRLRRTWKREDRQVSREPMRFSSTASF